MQSVRECERVRAKAGVGSRCRVRVVCLRVQHAGSCTAVLPVWCRVTNMTTWCATVYVCVRVRVCVTVVVVAARGGGGTHSSYHTACLEQAGMEHRGCLPDDEFARVFTNHKANKSWTCYECTSNRRRCFHCGGVGVGGVDVVACEVHSFYVFGRDGMAVLTP